MKTPCMKCGKGYGSDYDGLCTDCRGRTAWEQRVKNGELVKVPGNHPVTQAWKGRDMNKLTALIEAAKAAKAWNYFDVQEGNGEEVFDPFHDLANPATILELCALLEKAEAAMNSPSGRKYVEALAAIKQWKEQA